jgi:hypothetical protein
MEDQDRGIPFYSTQDVIINKHTHIAVNYMAGEGAFEVEFYQPAQINNSLGGYVLAGSVRFSSPDARRWIEAIVKSQGLADVHMHLNGTSESEPRKRPLVIAENDEIRLKYDVAARSMRVEAPGGSFGLPLAKLMEFIGQVAKYEKQMNAAQSPPPPLIPEPKKLAGRGQAA